MIIMGVFVCVALLRPLTSFGVTVERALHCVFLVTVEHLVLVSNVTSVDLEAPPRFSACISSHHDNKVALITSMLGAQEWLSRHQDPVSASNTPSSREVVPPTSISRRLLLDVCVCV